LFRKVLINSKLPFVSGKEQRCATEKLSVDIVVAVEQQRVILAVDLVIGIADHALARATAAR
jgi:hypothetical protein